MRTLVSLAINGRRVPRPCPVRHLSSSALASQLAKPVQSYISTSRDPYLNLSIEHYLLQKSEPDSAVLFLYINRPSIIIGRNQNPWLEVNLGLLNVSRSRVGSRPQTESSQLGAIDLVRRRSGGGTVFHDEGNVNWSVITTGANFTRDKHAEMVVRALWSCDVHRARVNERHDIVLDQIAGPTIKDHDISDTHCTPFTATDPSAPRPLKVSGSAYKLTRGRALHHGTCLLSSPNLNVIPHYLHSPAKPFIKARGVQSVSSPVGNILLSNGSFISAVQDQFRTMYGNSAKLEPGEVGEEQLEAEDVLKGYDELKSLSWTFLQTPQFSCSSQPYNLNRTVAPDLPPFHLDKNQSFNITVRNGSITESELNLPKATKVEQNAVTSFKERLVGRNLHEISNWEAVFRDAKGYAGDLQKLTTWLSTVLPPL